MIPTVLAAPNIAPYRPELTLPTDGSAFGAQINAFTADCVKHGYNCGYLRPGSVQAEVSVTIPSKFDLIGMGRPDTNYGGDGTAGRLAWGGGVKIATPFNSPNPAIAMIGTNKGNDTSGMVISPGLFNMCITGVLQSTRALAVGATTLIDVQNVYRLRMANIWAGNDFMRVLRLSNVWDSDIWSFSSNNGGFSDPTKTTDVAAVRSYTGRPFLGVETAIGRSLGVPAVEIVSPNTSAGADVSNNIRIYSMHIESNAHNGVPLMVWGGNGGMIQCIGCKIEANEGCVPMIVLDGQHGFRYEGWLMGGSTGSPYVDVGSVPAGTPWSNYTMPALVLAQGCYTPRFDVSMSHTSNGGATPALFRFINCADPHVDANVSDGLARVTTARMLFDGCADVSTARTRCYAPSYLLSVTGANQQERSIINGTTTTG